MKALLILCLSGLLLVQGTAQITDSLTTRVHAEPFQLRKIYLPALMIGSGILFNNNREEGLKMEIAEERNEWMPHFRTHIDDYLQFAPVAVVYGLDAMGIPSKTDRANRTAIFIKGELAMLGATAGVKYWARQPRPDGSNLASLPSGHTAQAFASATFLAKEFGERFKWMPYAAYGTASAVGILRMANNKHYISDVLIGAGIGILSMKASYWTHQYKWGRKNRVHTLSLD